MVGLPEQTYEDALHIADHAAGLLESLKGDKRVVPFVAPLAPFLDPGSPAFENPEKYGYKKFCHTLEDHRRAILAPSWKHILSYETEWLDRDQIVSATYQVAARLNELKHDYGIVDPETYQVTSAGLQAAQDYIKQIDGLLAAGLGEKELNDSLAELHEGVLRANDATICGHDELKWPVGGKFVDIFGLLRIWAIVTWEALSIAFGNSQQSA
jgi:hypothetical protein